MTVVADISRREFVVGAASILAITAVGCGDDAPREPSRPSTRTFVDVSGEPIEVPDRATRIVATNDQNAGAQLLSLGAPVIGIASRDGVIDPSIANYFDVQGITLVGEHFEPNIELISTLEPDLIVHEGFDGGTTLQPNVLAKLRRIAPVVSIDAFRPIDEVIADFARLIGGGAIARFDQQQAELDDLIASLRDLLGERWSEVTASFIISNAGAVEAWGPSTLGATNILSDVGVTWVPLMMEADHPANGGYMSDISLELLPEFSADLVLVDTSFGGGEIMKHPLFREFPAVTAGQVIEFDSAALTDTHYPGVIAIAEFLIEQVEGMDLRTDLV